jgi:hypothetical protein
VIKRSRLRGLVGAIFKKPVNPAKLRQMLAQARQKAQTVKPSPASPANPPPPPTRA